MKTSLTAIIPTLNNIQGLKYLKDYFKEKPYKIVIVDNAKKNLGFAGAVNKGARDAKTKWLLILNDDIKFKDNTTLDKLIDEAEKKKLDALSPILINSGGKIENLGYKVLPFGKAKLILNTKYSILNTNIHGLTAACLLIKNSVFKKLAGFDESFFAYLEDIDLFFRFTKSGYKMGISQVEVFHNHMTTTKTMGNFKARQDMINWWRLYFKHPEKFRFDLKFIEERLRNLSGFIKASLKI